MRDFTLHTTVAASYDPTLGRVRNHHDARVRLTAMITSLTSELEATDAARA